MFIQKTDVLPSQNTFCSNKKSRSDKSKSHQDDRSSEGIDISKTLDILAGINSSLIFQPENSRITLYELTEDLADKNIKAVADQDKMNITVFDEEDNPVMSYGRFFKSDAVARISDYEDGILTEKWLSPEGNTSTIINRSQKTGLPVTIEIFDDSGTVSSVLKFDEQNGKKKSETFFKKDGKTVNRFIQWDTESGEVVSSYSSKEKRSAQDDQKNIFQRFISKLKK